VFIVADVDLYSECLALALAAGPDVEVVGTASCRLAAAAVADAGPDVLLVDVGCPHGLDLITEVVAAPNSPSVVALAAPEAEEEIVACIEAGVSAFVAADASFGDLLATLARVGRGEPVVSPRIATTLIRRVRALADSNAADVGPALTARELEIVGLITRGLSNKEIASALSIEVSTVKNHVHSILGKLAVTRRSDVPAKVWPVRATTPREWSMSGSRSRI
jgi:DNA-binding NarL/FixJ family response regulator